jgi:hypothetical protein
MRGAAIITLLLSQTLGASEARFTDQLWVPMEPLYQRILASHAHPDGEHRALLAGAVREALQTLASKAPDGDWRALLVEDAAQIASTPKTAARMTRATEAYTSFLVSTAKNKPFGEGLAVVLAEYWMNFELRNDRGESTNDEFVETLAELTRMMNSAAARMDDAGRTRLKEVFTRAAREKLAFEEQ